MAQVQQRPIVQVPDHASDRPVWARVGVIAAVGFIIGMAWPRLAGVRLGPVPPDEGRPSAAAVASGSAARLASAAPVASGAPEASAPVPGSGHAGTSVAIGPARVLSCRTAKGKALEECDAPDFDVVAASRLKALSKCPASHGLNGKLSIGFDLDFARNNIRLVRGRSTTLSPEAVASIWNCLQTEFQKARLDDVTHKHARYTIFYNAQFVPAGKVPDVEPAEKADAAESQPDKAKEPSLGTGQVVYDTVLVRDEPKEGKVVARLVRGTRVQLLSRKGGWYRIRFGDREGWVYQGSIAQ